MSLSGCRSATAHVSDLLADAAVADAWRELRRAHAAPQEFVDALCRFASPEMAELMRAEFAVLPPVTVTAVVEAWGLADAGGRPFDFVSVAPAEPVDFARRRRVRLTIDIDEARVTLALGHIPTRHAEWYGADRVSSRPAALAGAS